MKMSQLYCIFKDIAGSSESIEYLIITKYQTGSHQLWQMVSYN